MMGHFCLPVVFVSEMRAGGVMPLTGALVISGSRVSKLRRAIFMGLTAVGLMPLRNFETTARSRASSRATGRALTLVGASVPSAASVA